MSRELLRHTVATVAYRGAKVIRDAPGEFAALKACDSTRTPLQILAHIGDLFEWALSMAEGSQRWSDSKPLPWDEESKRFFRTIEAFDAYLQSDKPLGAPEEKLFQGPIADALTHVGQIAMLRRVSGQPIRAENYFKADIEPGRVGSEQAAPRREFD